MYHILKSIVETRWKRLLFILSPCAVSPVQYWVAPGSGEPMHVWEEESRWILRPEETTVAAGLTGHQKPVFLQE